MIKSHFRDDLVDQDDETNGTYEAAEKRSAQDIIQKTETGHAGDEENGTRSACDQTGDPRLEHAVRVMKPTS